MSHLSLAAYPRFPRGLTASDDTETISLSDFGGIKRTREHEALFKGVRPRAAWRSLGGAIFPGPGDYARGDSRRLVNRVEIPPKRIGL